MNATERKETILTRLRRDGHQETANPALSVSRPWRVGAVRSSVVISRAPPDTQSGRSGARRVEQRPHGARRDRTLRRAKTAPSAAGVEVRSARGDQVTRDGLGSRAKAATSSSAHGQPSAMRNIRRRAERTITPAAWSSA